MDAKYKAFISYSHTDEKWARWLQRSLESYRLPKLVVREKGLESNRLIPIFRDREELGASADLSETIQQALAASENLIVVCSPDAVASHWVNEEINQFKRLGKADRIFCLLVDDPSTSFPPSVLVDTDGDGIATTKETEPLAADVRRSGDGTQGARLKIVAALLKIGLDGLKHRHQRRRMRLMVASNVGAVIVAVSFGVVAWIALKSSEDSARRQSQAEQLVTFMLGDLRSRLEPIGRLDVLDAVGDEASRYFDSLQDADATDAVLLSRAKALRQLGDIRMRQGRLSDAALAFGRALDLNGLLSERAPRDTGRLFELAQAEFWVGYAHKRNDNLEAATTHLRRYLKHANALVGLDPDKPEYTLEVGYANSNLGTIHIDLGNPSEAGVHFAAAESAINILLERDRKNTQLKTDLAQVLAWQGTASLALGKLTEAIAYHSGQVDQLRSIAVVQPNDKPNQRLLAVGLLLLGEMLALDGKRGSAKAKFNEAHEIMTDLASYDPANSDWQRNAARADWFLGRISEQEGDIDEAIKKYERAFSTFATLVQQDKQQARWQRDFAETASTVLRIHRENGNDTRASTLVQTIRELETPANPRLDCEVALVQGDRTACQDTAELAEDALKPQTDPRSYMSLYGVLHTQRDPRQENVWEDILNRGIKDRAFVNTM